MISSYFGNSINNATFFYDPQRIVGGNPTNPNEFPYQVNLRYGRNLEFYCGGSILNTIFILTAAHCLESKYGPLNPDEITVVAGDHILSDIDGKEQFRNLLKVFKHKGYNRKSMENDIALLALSSPLEFNQYVSSISWVKTPTVFSNMAVVTGWGALKYRHPASNVLQKVNVTIVPREECHDKYINAKWPYKPMNISQDMMCAGQIGKDSCQADSGGPLVCQMPETGAKVQCGVVSFGHNCGIEYPGVYADLLHFSNWIETTMRPFIYQRLQENCPKGFFRCTTNETSQICIPERWKCDGERDCRLGEDEEKCGGNFATLNNMLKSCSGDEHEFKCNSGECILKAFECDLIKDCKDESDEASCQAKECSSSQWRCANGDCIYDKFRCDKEADCADSSDEVECVQEMTQNCSNSQFSCRQSCIPKSFRCDTDFECEPDGEDEEGCFEINFNIFNDLE